MQIDIANLGNTNVSSCSSDHILEDWNKIVPTCISLILWLWALISLRSEERRVGKECA